MIKSKSFKKISKNQNKDEVEKTEKIIKKNTNKYGRNRKKEKEKKLIQEQNKLKKYLKENYFNYNCNIYRCQIPIINIDEINHQIETYCNCIYTINKNKNINNYIFPYKYFEKKA